MRNIVFIIVILLISTELQSQIVLDKFTESRFKPILSFNIGFPFGFSSDEFFKIYREKFEGKQRYTRHSPTIAIGYKTWITRNVRLGLSANFLRSTFYDYYYTGGLNYSRNHNQEFLFQTIPIILSGELIPYDKQFRSYIGGGIGLNANHIHWKERVNSTFPLDLRKGGVHYSEASIAPAFRIFSGLELGFDEFPESEFLGSIIFEFQYTYSPRKVDLFKNVKKQFIEPLDRLDKKLIIFPGFFCFQIGLSFNLLTEKNSLAVGGN